MSVSLVYITGIAVAALLILALQFIGPVDKSFRTLGLWLWTLSWVELTIFIVLLLCGGDGQ